MPHRGGDGRKGISIERGIVPSRSRWTIIENPGQYEHFRFVRSISFERQQSIHLYCFAEGANAISTKQIAY